MRSGAVRHRHSCRHLVDPAHRAPDTGRNSPGAQWRRGRAPSSTCQPVCRWPDPAEPGRGRARHGQRPPERAARWAELAQGHHRGPEVGVREPGLGRPARARCSNGCGPAATWARRGRPPTDRPRPTSPAPRTARAGASGPTASSTGRPPRAARPRPCSTSSPTRRSTSIRPTRTSRPTPASRTRTASRRWAPTSSSPTPPATTCSASPRRATR